MIFFAGLFWFTFLLCLGTYVFYPLVIWLVGLIRPLRVDQERVHPFVSVIVPAFNEARHIARKIENTLAVDYPRHKMEILVGSDGSTDDTAAIMEQYVRENVLFFDFSDNRGKTAVQNDLVEQARGEVLIFTDAASFVHRDAFSALVSNFNDARIGCVAGRMRFSSADSNLTTQSQGLYWKYEGTIRVLESRLGALIGVDGPLYAVRRKFYVPLEHNMISDFLTPLLVLKQGGKAVLEPGAIVEEEPTKKPAQEYSTRRRITLRGLVGLQAHKYLLNPLKYPFLSLQIMFHKVIRWGIGLLWGINIISCTVLSAHPLFLVLLAGHLVFILLALLGWRTSAGPVSRFLTIPYYFSLVNLAASMAIIDFLRKKQVISWKPVRE